MIERGGSHQNRMAKEDRKHTLLIVDDEPGLLQTLRHQFFRDYRVLTAESGHAALELLGVEDVHVILSDQRMPSMTGDAFLAQARAFRPDAVRILFTGYADIQSVIDAVKEGRIFRYILKPWDPVELEDRERQVDGHRGQPGDRGRVNAEREEAHVGMSGDNHGRSEANEKTGAIRGTGQR